MRRARWRKSTKEGEKNAVIGARQNTNMSRIMEVAFCFCSFCPWWFCIFSCRLL